MPVGDAIEQNNSSESHFGNAKRSYCSVWKIVLTAVNTNTCSRTILPAD